jgi:hypothetical protein
MEPDGVTEVADELAAALAGGDLERVHALATPTFWEEQEGAQDYAGRIPVDGTVQVLGTLGDRSLLLVAAASGVVRDGYVLEQAWTHGTPPLIEQERLFTLLDVERERASGDEDRLAMLATKIAAQEAGQAMCAALAAGDGGEVRSMVEPERAELAGVEAARAARATRAELVGSVGPRTLVRVWSGDSDVTVEYLWRRQGDAWLIGYVREFSRAGWSRL